MGAQTAAKWGSIIDGTFLENQLNQMREKGSISMPEMATSNYIGRLSRRTGT
jgi:hypothetical protein